MMKTQRKAFSLITAIFLIVLMSSIAILVMSLSGKIIKETTGQYKKEQAMLLAKSYTELAIMTVTANDRNATGNCITDINANVGSNDPTSTGEGYRVRTRISYIGAAGDIQSCADTRELDNPSVGNNELNIIVDVYVEYKDITQGDITNSPWITYHRRTLQKI
ncbi:type II secretion system protein [Sulfurovum sp. zt1-1]|uniref:Type II secretion system protein n=1 Tax=Sulfurovum zhangzhouensis TaxID=3019067 RepID=A0ABT7QWT1_9BACT|nr:type II secretion system protein [Sulfurovum zhangzhouensis]MDM5271237.1 type II secretion system protein [Sulfurovum zhangzhouensis]